jgi:hypothetical protein
MQNSADIVVGLTDLLLSAEALVLGCLLLSHASKVRSYVVALFYLLGASSFLGAIFHLFFPLKVATESGWIVWLLVAGSIGLTAILLWCLTAFLTFGKHGLRVATLLSPLYFVVFMFEIAAVDYHYGTIILFYAPAVVAFGAVALCKAIKKKAGWSTVFVGVALSAIAAVVQSSTLSLALFDHNTLYHILQAVALYVLYKGFCKII